MKIRPLAPVGHPDFNDLVVHFTGRPGPTNASFDVTELSASQRLARILSEGRLRGFTMFNTGERAVCFTESTRRGAQWLVQSGRYRPCGVAFAKQLVFDRGGGPALYVRGDDWDAVAAWPSQLRLRATRFWPGAEAEGDEELSHELLTRSEWLVEREWRAPVDDNGDWSFALGEVAFLIVPDSGWVDAQCVGLDPQDPFVVAVQTLPRLVMGPTGEIVENVGVNLKAD